MNHSILYFGMLLSVVFSVGCASVDVGQGPRGPEIVSSGYVTDQGHYARIGLQFSTPGDFVAIFSLSRWESPIAPGGALSWVNPRAWSEDAGRTLRILFGEAVLLGAIMTVSDGGGSLSGDGGGNGSNAGPTVPDEGPPAGPGGDITLPPPGSGGPGARP